MSVHYSYINLTINTTCLQVASEYSFYKKLLVLLASEQTSGLESRFVLKNLSVIEICTTICDSPESEGGGVICKLLIEKYTLTL